MKVRTSYPESKRMCESLCTAYASQYSVPVKVLRLTQTFGPGVRYDDGRVFAEFARCAIERRNIVLHTDGATRRSYLYTADAVSAILTVLLKGIAGEAYNAANEATFCSIREMAQLVCSECAGGKIGVEIQLEEIMGGQPARPAQSDSQIQPDCQAQVGLPADPQSGSLVHPAQPTSAAPNPKTVQTAGSAQQRQAADVKSSSPDRPEHPDCQAPVGLPADPQPGSPDSPAQSDHPTPSAEKSCTPPSARGYAPTLTMNLDTSKLKSLGWQPHYPLDEMFRRLCSYMQQDASSPKTKQ